MPNWRSEYRRCDNCRGEYRPQREAQSYCGPACRRAAAYGRERFNKGTKGRRRRRLEASDKLQATLVAGSFRNEDFSSIEPFAIRKNGYSVGSVERTNAPAESLMRITSLGPSPPRCSRTTRSAASKDQATLRSCALPFASYNSILYGGVIE
jgi:hypothetical protein